MLIKVCGIATSRHLKDIESLGIDMTGVIRYKPSPRYSPEVPTKNSMAQVAVYVNESASIIEADMEKYQFDFIQLHGDESPEFVKNLGNPDRLIKAIAVASAEDLIRAKKYASLAKYILLDTKTPKHGGSGEKFNWDLLKQCNFPFILSGGIGPSDAEKIIQLSNDNPYLIGIDLNSRFELTPGVKDVTALQNFIKTIRNETR